MIMNDARAKAILGGWIGMDQGLRASVPSIRWRYGGNMITLEGRFTIEALEAIVWWMRHHPGEGEILW